MPKRKLYCRYAKNNELLKKRQFNRNCIFYLFIFNIFLRHFLIKIYLYRGTDMVLVLLCHFDFSLSSFFLFFFVSPSIWCLLSLALDMSRQMYITHKFFICKKFNENYSKRNGEW